MLFVLLSPFNLFQTLFFYCLPINFSPHPLLYWDSPMLSSSRCCVSDLLVRLPHQVCYLHDTLMVCWPFLRHDFCVCFYVSKIHFCSEGFNTLEILCRTANLNVVSSTAFPSSLVIAGFWALQPWWSVWTSLALHTAIPFSSWEKPLYFFSAASLWVPASLAKHWIFSPACPCRSSLASSCSVSSAGILLFRLVSWSLANQLHIWVCIILHATSVKRKDQLFYLCLSMRWEPPPLGHLFRR